MGSGHAIRVKQSESSSWGTHCYAQVCREAQLRLAVCATACHLLRFMRNPWLNKTAISTHEGERAEGSAAFLLSCLGFGNDSLINTSDLFPSDAFSQQQNLYAFVLSSGNQMLRR